MNCFRGISNNILKYCSSWRDLYSSAGYLIKLQKLPSEGKSSRFHSGCVLHLNHTWRSLDSRPIAPLSPLWFLLVQSPQLATHAKYGLHSAVSLQDQELYTVSNGVLCHHLKPADWALIKDSKWNVLCRHGGLVHSKGFWWPTQRSSFPKRVPASHCCRMVSPEKLGEFLKQPRWVRSEVSPLLPKDRIPPSKKSRRAGQFYDKKQDYRRKLCVAVLTPSPQNYRKH